MSWCEICHFPLLFVCKFGFNIQSGGIDSGIIEEKTFYNRLQPNHGKSERFVKGMYLQPNSLHGKCICLQTPAHLRCIQETTIQLCISIPRIWLSASSDRICPRIILFCQSIPMSAWALKARCCLFPSHFLLLRSDTPGSAADGAWPVGVGRQPALARNFQFQLDLTEGGSHYPHRDVGSEKNTAFSWKFSLQHYFNEPHVSLHTVHSCGLCPETSQFNTTEINCTQC